MRRVLFTLGGVVAVVVAVTMLLRASREASEPALVTAWGDPDLQGIWTVESQIPIERPAQFAGKEVFTDEEIAELDRLRAGQKGREYRAERGTEADVAGAYSHVFHTVKKTGRRTSLIVDPPDGRIPPLTAEAQQRREALRAFQVALLQATEACKDPSNRRCAGGKYGPPSPRYGEVPPVYLTGSTNRADGPEELGMSVRCMLAVNPDFGSNQGIDGFAMRVVQAPGRMAITYDTSQGQGWQRVIPMTARPHLPSDVRQWWGDSRARREGQSLVVDVTNFTAKTDFFGARENLHLVERWTRTSANTLEYVVTMEDPTTWTRPWTLKVDMHKQNDEENRVFAEPRCHEGNYSIPTMLQSVRQMEEAYAKGRGPHPATHCVHGCASYGPDEETRDPLQ
jgi:hypothetical protein